MFIEKASQSLSFNIGYQLRSTAGGWMLFQKQLEFNKGLELLKRAFDWSWRLQTVWGIWVHQKLEILCSPLLWSEIQTHISSQQVSVNWGSEWSLKIGEMFLLNYQHNGNLRWAWKCAHTESLVYTKVTWTRLSPCTDQVIIFEVWIMMKINEEVGILNLRASWISRPWVRGVQ